MNDRFPPDFDMLEKLTEYDIKSLGGPKATSEVDAFIIALATAFNDLKDIYWLWEQLFVNKPEKQNLINPQCGQWNGMGHFVLRRIMATFYEVLELIYKNRKVLESQRIMDAEHILDHKPAKCWKNIKLMGTHKPESLPSLEKKVYYAVRRIRSDMAYHYYGTKTFSMGMKSYFSKFGDKSKVYASLGKSMGASRFYFADAACQNRYDDILKEFGVTQGQVLSSVKNLNLGLRSIVNSYLEITSGKRKASRIKVISGKDNQ